MDKVKLDMSETKETELGIIDVDMVKEIIREEAKTYGFHNVSDYIDQFTDKLRKMRTRVSEIFYNDHVYRAADLSCRRYTFRAAMMNFCDMMIAIAYEMRKESVEKEKLSESRNAMISRYSQHLSHIDNEADLISLDTLMNLIMGVNTTDSPVSDDDENGGNDDDREML